MNKVLVFLAAFSFAVLAPVLGYSCTNYLVTKGASADGSTMITYAADSHVLYGELYHWPAGKWAPGTMMDVVEWDTGKFLGRIPQASETYNVVGNLMSPSASKALITAFRTSKRINDIKGNLHHRHNNQLRQAF